jgi:intein/homing endonuclease
MDCNQHQSILKEEGLDKEVYNEIVDLYSTVTFIQNLTSPSRKYAKDLERDEFGRIKVDITNPHILEDMDYFRQPAIHYEKFKKYTNLHPNSSPTSSYRKFWKEEAKRCREGLVRPSDGEWIPGPYYFYLNYSPILKNKVVPGTKRSERIRGFPDVYDGSYLHYHYKQQARDVGKHAGELKRRGIGFSYEGGSDLARILILGDTAINKGDVQAFAIASEKEYLVKDGILNKFDSIVNWCASTTPWPRLKSKDSLNNMVWEMGYTDLDGLTQGTHNSVIGVTTQGNPDHARGKRGTIYWDEWGLFPNLLKSWNVARESTEEGDYAHSQMIGGGCVCAGTKIWTNTGSFINIENLQQPEGTLGYNGVSISRENITYWQEPLSKPCYKIITNTKRELRCSEDHPILWSRQNYGVYTNTEERQLTGCTFYKTTKFVNAKDIKVGDQIMVIEEVPVFGNKTMWEPRFIGWLIGDGTYGKDHSPRLSNCEDEINNYIDNNFDTKITNSYITKSTSKLYRDTTIKGICNKLRELGIYGQTKLDKTLPVGIQNYNEKDICELLGGLFDTDGYIEYRRISISSMSFNLLNEIRFLCQKLGIHGSIHTHIKNINNPKSKNDYFNFVISDKKSVLTFIDKIYLFPKYKQDKLLNIRKFFVNKKERGASSIFGARTERVVSVEYIGINPVYNLTTSSTHTYIVNGIITHNTGGVEGADFAGAEEMFYNPEGYNILALPNVYDKNTNGKTVCAFFFPAYLNRLGCYDQNGNSDIIKALIEILNKRIKIKYSATDPNTIVQHKAEMCCTPQEAIMRREGSIFPVADIKDYLSEISPDLNKFVGAHYTGHLKINIGGSVVWDNYEFHPVLRNYPLRDELDKIGSVEIFEMPQRLQDGTIPYWRYIAGIDPIDSDEGLYTESLGSIFIFDTWKDRIVAEYTGRPVLASDFYDGCYKLLNFYNAIANYESNIKGLFAYFDTNHILQYLCDTPQILKDMDQAKGSLIGNRAKGTNTNKFIASWGRKLQADWLVSTAYTSEEEEVKVLNLHKVRSVGYLKELLAWNPDINTDRVSAMGMCMILRADREKYEHHKFQEKMKTIYDDPWFKKFGSTKISKVMNPAKSLNSSR